MIASSPLYQQWGQPGLVLPDSEQRRLELVEKHLAAVKRCDQKDLRRVYENDYNQFMNIVPARNQPENRRYSQKRNGGRFGNNKRYRRF